MSTKPRIITLMFHRVNDASLGYQPAQFAKYLDYLVKHFPIVVPGDPLTEDVAVCLTFDDAYYDFYHDVYPLLIKHNIKAVLAVSVGYIVDDTNVTPQERLSVPYVQGMEDPKFACKTPFCTWKELREMSQSGHVIIASHGLMHQNLADKNSDLTQEIILSQKILQERLGIPINNFVYPYGRMSEQSHKMVCQNYDYGIRIGSALNLGWDTKNRFVYRINADPLWTKQKAISTLLIHKLTLKYWGNRLRLK
ncbi:MAG: polysaccharide deacetylase family protein [Proteobacteria bacterium]|nr:polysaccharide deacetylase family protein [Pseudomonadota bacterium]